MDANTASVIIAIVTLVVSPIVLFIIKKSNDRHLKAVSTQIEEQKKTLVGVDTKVDTVEKKLDENHKLNNGNLTKLLETTEKLATAQEKARGEAAESAEKTKGKK